jgi:Zn-finger protein
MTTSSSTVPCSPKLDDHIEPSAMSSTFEVEQSPPVHVARGTTDDDDAAANDGDDVERRPRLGSPDVDDVGDRLDKGYRLSTNNLNFGIPTNQGTMEHVEEQHGSESWRYRTIVFMHQSWVQRTFAMLLLLDVLVLFTEMYLVATYPPCSTIIQECIACCPYSLEEAVLGEHLRWLSSENGAIVDDSTHHEAICEEGYNDEIGQPSCDAHKHSAVHTTEDVLFGITVAILSLFLLENIIEMVTIGPLVFFRQMWFVLDVFIVSVSLALELYFHISDSLELETLAGLLIFARLWRFVRIGHGLIEVTSEWTHEQYDEAIEYAQEMEKILRENKLPLPNTTQRAKDLLESINEKKAHLYHSDNGGGSEHKK